MTHADVEIKIVDRQTIMDTFSIDYVPFGVKVLKLRIQRNQNTKPALGPVWIRPQGFIPPDVTSSDPARWRAYELVQGASDFWVGWGAGDEQGFCVKTKDIAFNKVPAALDDDGTYYVYLHLIHRPTDPFTHQLEDHSLVVEAIGKEGQIYGAREICLTVPEAATNPARTRWHWAAETGVSTLSFAGSGEGEVQIPRYVSRWWPTCRVIYNPADDAVDTFLRDFRIEYQRRVDNTDRGRMDVYLGETLLAELTGYLALPLHDCRLVTTEIFQFPDDYHLVIRLWFYWLHLNFSTEQLMTFVPAARRTTWLAEAERVREGINDSLIPWHKREEVPDIERFDLLLDPQNLDVKYVGTDTHWQEYWAAVKDGEPLRAKIASWQEIARIIKDKLQNKVPERETPPIFDPLANGLCDLVNEWSGHQCPYRGSGQLIPVDKIRPGRQYDVCPGCGSHFIGQGARAVGLWDKHAPLLDNALVAEDAVSTNVLEG